ncbi:[protein-PII] uridylyltransferase [Neptunicella marina]|uniref:Bifunctional uridylyltransferase/uridylyl-removing enzyme n=1 Tax=Neptunicella marina TaxID=2125989 RepID=A0A8J6ISC6_9ALTE|nr:[protein-PII] uridylyltransferase [Neptunicella marina]
MSLHAVLQQIQQLTDINNLSAFKQCNQQIYRWLQQDFATTDIKELVTGRAKAVDALLIKAWQLLELPAQEHIALVAVGGYGRQQLQPYSDVDILLLSPKKLTSSSQEKLGQFITLLWDIGLDIGQSVRTIKECVKLAKDDITIATNLLESRVLSGDCDTFLQLQDKIQGDKIWSSDAFFQAKYQEQVHRHQKFDGTAYNLEPNVKENPGCLRDIQSIGWVAKKHFNALSGKELVEHGYFSEQELEELLECRENLWRVRCALHLIAGRSENRLLFDYQPQVAEKLGYGEEGKASVEKMMKSFFRITRRVSELNEVLLQHFKQDVLHQKIKQIVEINQQFSLHDNLIVAKDDNVFNTPEQILAFFILLADLPQVEGIHSSTLRLLRNARRRYKNQYFSERASCRELFMQLVRHPRCFGLPWDLMHKHGIMQAYLREWDQIVGMMQFDLFHAYTVDEHTHRLIKFIYHYTQPEGKKAFPRCGRILANMDHPEMLFIAAIFHDIGKGRGGDHSVLGAADVKVFCQLHQIEPQDARLIEWLVANHLTMSVVAQRRDIYDPEVITEFSTQMNNQTYLNHLYALTLADIRATNNNLWNDWKASLLRELYLITSKALESEQTLSDDFQERLERHKTQAMELALEKGAERDEVLNFWKQHDTNYFVRYKPKQLAWQASAITKAQKQHTDDQDITLVELSDETSRAGTEVLIYVKDRANLFAQVVSVLDSRNCTVHDANIMSTPDGYVLDTFIILDQDGNRLVSPGFIHELQQGIIEQLERPGSEHINNRKMPRRMKHLNVPTKMRFFNNHANHTLVDLEALDAPGLLAKISRVFVSQNLSLHMAKITTIGERAEDVFILSNAEGNALDQQQQLALKKQLVAVLDDNNE